VSTTSPEEQTARRELAACYRLFDHLGWAEAIFNHITLRVPGPQGEPCYLINPFGLHYSEVTAANLVKVDLRGEIVGDRTHPVNRAGYVIHSAIHAARTDAHCVMHVHTTAGSAVACKASGLRHDNFYSAMMGADRLPRLRRCDDFRRRAAPAGRLARWPSLADPAQPRHSGGGCRSARGISATVDPSARLRNTACQRSRAGSQHPDCRGHPGTGTPDAGCHADRHADQCPPHVSRHVATRRH
jgi:hypothetical protein